ncbi:MAG TPA: septal ring lytic transglycosylase RlpA family protein [Burkholderiaceae bacterium]
MKTIARRFESCRRNSLLPAVITAGLLAACSTPPRMPPPNAAPVPTTASPTSGAAPGEKSNTTRLPALPAAGSGRGGYYQDDGPGDRPPDGLLDLPDPMPKVEAYSATGNKPYVVFGKTYVPMVDERPFTQRGTGSWYGKKFHGQKTSSGELYDMYKLTAAHPTLPIPSYARVTNLGNGAQVIVRINDRGPFHSGRIIDLSYTAALKLGYLGRGSSELQVDRLLPDEIARINAAGPRNGVAAGSATGVAAIAPQSSQAATSTMPVSPDLGLAKAGPDTSASPPVSLPTNPAPSIPTFDSASPASGFYLQFGAYTEQGNAEAVRSRLQQSWDGSLPPLEVYSVGLFYRLHSGPFATREEAQTAAQRLQANSDIKPVVVQR